MVKVSEISAFAAHRGRGRARFDSPARRRAPRRTAAERHARDATAGGATVVPGCAMDSGGVVRGRGESAFPTRKTAAWNRVLSAAVGGWVRNSISVPTAVANSHQAQEKCSRELPRLIQRVAATPQTRRRLVIASHASAVVVLGRSLSHTPARLPRLRALARHTPRRSFVRTRRPRLHLGREIPQFAAFERARGFAASHGVQGSWAPREDAQAAFARRIHTKQKGALVAWGIPSSLHAPWRSALVRRSGGTRW
jgi:hypothetical protein